MLETHRDGVLEFARLPASALKGTSKCMDWGFAEAGVLTRKVYVIKDAARRQ